MFRLRIWLLLLALSIVSTVPAPAAPVAGYTVVARYPHSTSSYTEGLLYLNGLFYEGTGLNGHSGLLANDPRTGETLQHVDLSPQYLILFHLYSNDMPEFVRLLWWAYLKSNEDFAAGASIESGFHRSGPTLSLLL